MYSTCRVCMYSTCRVCMYSTCMCPYDYEIMTYDFTQVHVSEYIFHLKGGGSE